MTISPSKELNYRVFLGPDPRTLHAWGALDAYEIKENWQIWRLATSLFLSPGFSVYMVSSGALMIVGFIVENPLMSPMRMAAFFILSGICANLFSVCVQDEVSVGCLPAVMALISGLLASVIVNWKALAGAGMLRICLIFMTIFLFVILLLLSADNYVANSFYGISLAGEGGGFMSGLCLGLMMMPFARPN